MESMGKTLHNLFKSYCSQLLKLELLMAGKNDLIAVEEATLKSVFTQKVRIFKTYLKHLREGLMRNLFIFLDRT